MLTLTADQQNAHDQFIAFLMDPIETVFVLSGYSGTGKSTLVGYILANLHKYYKTIRLINPKALDYDIALTATTNKAAEALQNLTGQPVSTIHSKLSLRVVTDPLTGVSSLTPSNHEKVENTLLFVDEYSYVDHQLMGHIFQRTRNCKIVFVGDPAQLTPVKSADVPVRAANFKEAKLEQVVRQAEGHPIIALSAKFRDTVNSGQFFSFIPDGQYIQHLSREDFNTMVSAEFTRPDWKYQDSKVLCWTNNQVVAYNRWIRDQVAGDPDFQVEDYAICNKYLGVRGVSFKTDATVRITQISGPVTEYDVVGKRMMLDNRATFFVPDHRRDAKQRLKVARDAEDYHVAEQIETRWADLRAAYASTINKAQGSTYNKVFIDLDDIRRCNSGNQIARMLYVAISRARHQCILTGDLV